MDKTKIKPIVLRLYRDGINKIINRDIVHFENDSLGLYIADNDPHTGFYFKIIDDGCVEMKPASIKNMEARRIVFARNKTIDVFKEWQQIIQDYNDIQQVLHIKDLEESYYEEFLSNIELIDEDAQTAPFGTDKQHFLIEYCHITRARLLKERTEENARQIDAVIADVDTFEKEIPLLTKAETTKRVFRIWAKIRKIGSKLFEDIAKGLIVDFAKDGIVHVSQTIRAALPEVVETVSKITLNM